MNDASFRVATPQSLDEVNALMARLGERLALSAALEERRATVLARIDERTEAKLAPLRQEAEAIENAIYGFAKKHRRSLTRERKSIELPAGKFGWRWRKGIVEVKNESLAIRSLKKLKQTKCIKVVESVLKNAVKQLKPELRSVVRGIRIFDIEYFWIEPENIKAVNRETQRRRLTSTTKPS